MSSHYGAVPRIISSGDGAPKEFVKEKRCNDVLFAVLYLVHLAVVISVLVQYSPENSEKDFTTNGVYKFVGIIALLAIVLSTLALGFMSAFAGALVEIALFLSLVATLGATGYAVYVGMLWIAIIGGVVFLSGCIFTYCVWKKIPVSILDSIRETNQNLLT